MTGEVFAGTFAEAWKSATAMRVLNDQQSALIEAKAKEIDAMYRQVADTLLRSHWGVAVPERFYGRGIPELLARETRPAGTLTATGVMALTTLAGMEWLRHRKNEIAAAEQSGDYSSLIDEFFEYLRALFKAWRVALGLEEA